jgi:hypothetical protein
VGDASGAVSVTGRVSEPEEDGDSRIGTEAIGAVEEDRKYVKGKRKVGQSQSLLLIGCPSRIHVHKLRVGQVVIDTEFRRDREGIRNVHG